MIFKSNSPTLVKTDEDLDKILEYVSDIKTECEARLTFIEQILENMKAKIEVFETYVSANTEPVSTSEVSI